MTLYNSILLAGVFQGFLLSLAFWGKNFKKKHQNHFLSTLLLLLSLAMLSKALFTSERYESFPQFWYLSDFVAYLITPFWFFTMQKCTIEKIKLTAWEYLFLAPVLFHVGFMGVIFLMGKKDFLAAHQEAWYMSSFYVFCFTAIGVNVAYGIKAHQVILRNRKIGIPKVLHQSHHGFLGILGIWLLLFLVSFFWGAPYHLNALAYDGAFLGLAFLMYFIGFWALIKPEVFHFLHRVWDDEHLIPLQEIAWKVEKYLTEKRPYLKASYTLTALAKDLDLNPMEISKAVNGILKTTFIDLINGYRLSYFLAIVQKEETSLTHAAIAESSGFGNKVSFYRAFKKKYGCTPKAYLARNENSG